MQSSNVMVPSAYATLQLALYGNFALGESSCTRNIDKDLRMYDDLCDAPM